VKRTFDAVIVGAGRAGAPLAARLSEAGWTVALIEHEAHGGTSIDTGCTPTKALRASARIAHFHRRAEDFGVNPSIAVTVDMRRVKQRKDAIVTSSRNELGRRMQNLERCTLYRGAARFTSQSDLSVGHDLLHAEHIFLNVGARPTIPHLDGIDHTPYLTSSTILDLEDLPSKLIVIGGGYVGLEFAQMYRRFGSEVTVIEQGTRLIAHEDSDVSDSIREILEREGVRVRTNAKCVRLRTQEEQVIVCLNSSEGESEISGSHLLLAVGRSPNTDDLGLEMTGIVRNEHGYIPVNEQLQTAVPGIWALGDCNGLGAFTHTSYNDVELVTANLLENESRTLSDRIPAHALYTDPPLAQIGLTEREVRMRGRPALVGIRPMSKVERAVEEGETQGFIKVLVDAESREILGASILGINADEAIHGILTAMYAGRPFHLLQRSAFIHPTVSELVPAVLNDLEPLI
jgi:pyruvate/2-oxoglutarate dehydrogenase complex dihydrolipoamide dehydrogenase (E3) component